MLTLERKGELRRGVRTMIVLAWYSDEYAAPRIVDGTEEWEPIQDLTSEEREYAEACVFATLKQIDKSL